MYKNRIEICKKCEYFNSYLDKLYQCSVCKCVLNIKARMSNQKCPLDKWGKQDIDISDKNCGGC